MQYLFIIFIMMYTAFSLDTIAVTSLIQFKKNDSSRYQFDNITTSREMPDIATNSFDAPILPKISPIKHKLKYLRHRHSKVPENPLHGSKKIKTLSNQFIKSLQVPVKQKKRLIRSHGTSHRLYRKERDSRHYHNGNRSDTEVELLIQIRDLLRNIDDSFENMRELNVISTEPNTSPVTHIIKNTRMRPKSKFHQTHDSKQDNERFLYSEESTLNYATYSSSKYPEDQELENDEQGSIETTTSSVPAQKMKKDVKVFPPTDLETSIENLEKENLDKALKGLSRTHKIEENADVNLGLSKDKSGRRSMRIDSKKEHFNSKILSKYNIRNENILDVLKSLKIREDEITPSNNENITEMSFSELANRNPYITGSLIFVSSFFILIVIVFLLYICRQIHLKCTTMKELACKDDIRNTADVKIMEKELYSDDNEGELGFNALLETLHQDDIRPPHKEPIKNIKKRLGDEDFLSIDKFLAWRKDWNKDLRRSRNHRAPDIMETIDPCRRLSRRRESESDTNESLSKHLQEESSGRESLEERIEEALVDARVKLGKTEAQDNPDLRKLMSQKTLYFK